MSRINHYLISLAMQGSVKSLSLGTFPSSCENSSPTEIMWFFWSKVKGLVRTLIYRLFQISISTTTKRHWKRIERILLSGCILYCLLGIGFGLCVMSFALVLYDAEPLSTLVFYVGTSILVAGLILAILALIISMIHDLNKNCNNSYGA